MFICYAKSFYLSKGFEYLNLNDLNCLPESMHQYTTYDMDNYDKSYLSFIPSEIQLEHEGKISMDIMKLNDKFLDEDEKALYSPDGYEFYFPHPIQKMSVTI